MEKHSTRNNAIVASINRLLHVEDPDIRSGRDWSIFRVPPNLFDVQKSAFLPKIISIGPFHYVSPLKDKMYSLKLRHLRRLLRRYKVERIGDVTEPGNIDLLENLVKAMKDLEQETRKCYSEPFDNINSDDFVTMMVIDGCFVIELLRLRYKHGPEYQNMRNGRSNSEERLESPIFTTRWLCPILQRDVIKLENQLPYFVLEKLFLLTTLGKEPSLKDLFAFFFRSMLSQDGSSYTIEPRGFGPMLSQDSSSYMIEPRESGTDELGHPLKLFRLQFVLEMLERFELQSCEQNSKLIYSAQELQESGVAFIKKKKANLLDISFDVEKKILQIPPLCIDENMTTLLLNIVAFEQCTEKSLPLFTNYFLFLDSLINTTKDVEILRKNGIIKYPLGIEKEVVDRFNNFGKEMLFSFDQCFLSVDMNVVNSCCRAYYDNKWHFWWSNLKRERFSNPWTFLSLVAAIVLLMLTLVQTIYTMVSYHHPN